MPEPLNREDGDMADKNSRREGVPLKKSYEERKPPGRTIDPPKPPVSPRRNRVD